MIYLVYSSAATHPMSEEELLEILRQSRSNNPRNGITGLLLYRDGIFMQLLEGPEDAVRSCFDRISQDPRHRDVIHLLEKSQRQRMFGEWSMAFEKIDPSPENLKRSEVDGFSSFLSKPFSPRELGGRLNDGLFLLLSFKKNSARTL